MSTPPLIFDFIQPIDTDVYSTTAVVLDQNGPTYKIRLLWLPLAKQWIFDLETTQGTAIVRGAWLRDRTDVLLGVSTPGRPKGSIVPYDPKYRGDPGRDAFFTEGVLLLYFPDRLDPEEFAKYPTPVF